MAIMGHAKGVAMPIFGSGLPSAFATCYGGTSLMARGDGGKVVFENAEVRKAIPEGRASEDLAREVHERFT
jgi:hypothetical protein